MSVSTIPAPVAAEASGAGSFFGSCQISANNFEAALNNAATQQKNASASERSNNAERANNTNTDRTNKSDARKNDKAEQSSSQSPSSLLKNQNEQNEVLSQLQAILGEDAGAEAFERITELLEKGSLSVQIDLDNLQESDFEKLAMSLLERLDLALKQISVLSEDESNGETDLLGGLAPAADENAAYSELEENAETEKPFAYYSDSEREAFLNILRDLMKVGLITPQEFEQALKNPEESTLPELLNSLKSEAKSLLAALENQKNGNSNTIKNSEIPPELLLQAKAEGAKSEKITLDEILNPIDKNILKLLENATDKKGLGEVSPSLQTPAAANGETRQSNAIPSAFSATPSAGDAPATPPTAEMPKTAGKEESSEPQARASWEGGELKIETFNPKTGEKLSSVPAQGFSRMQERINEFEVVKQVVAQAKFITAPTGEQKITMQLRPDHLGAVDLRVILNHGEMQIHAKVESATAQAAIENNIGLLREGLEKQGITLDRLEVSVEQREKNDYYSLNGEHERNSRKNNERGGNKKSRSAHLAVSIAKNANADTGRRLGYNTMEYLA